MAFRRPRTRRVLLAMILGAVLAGEITGIALARTLTPPPPPASSGAVDTAPAIRAAHGATAATGEAGDAIRARLPTADGQRADAPGDPATPPVRSAPSAHSIGVAVAAKATATGRSSGSNAGAPTAAYRGSNHVWIPSLGINKGVQSFPCSRNRPPDAGVYRWGCAGRNNIYLLAHAWSTFRPLHDAYVSGSLHKGMQAVYADGGGHVHTYSVIWWRVVAPTTAASWAWAPLGTPSMTLQTCVGADSQYRLMVRLVRIR